MLATQLPDKEDEGKEARTREREKKRAKKDHKKKNLRPEPGGPSPACSFSFLSFFSPVIPGSFLAFATICMKELAISSNLLEANLIYGVCVTHERCLLEANLTYTCMQGLAISSSCSLSANALQRKACMAPSFTSC